MLTEKQFDEREHQLTASDQPLTAPALQRKPVGKMLDQADEVPSFNRQPYQPIEQSYTLNADQDDYIKTTTSVISVRKKKESSNVGQYISTEIKT